MKFSEIAEKVKNGTIVFDTCGHSFSRSFKEQFVDRYERDLASANGSNDGNWKERDGLSAEETDKRMRDFYQCILDFEADKDEPISYHYDGDYCYGCGETLKWILNGDILTPRYFYNHKKKDFNIHPIDYRCLFEAPRPTTGEIEVGSTLVFANFFQWVEDAPEGKKYSLDYDLCSIRGLENITKYKCAHNIAYGQMSNMSIGIYVNSTKDSIIIGPAYHPAESKEFESEEEYCAALDKPVFEGYELVGTVCCDVWRWEATDANTIGEEGEKELAKRFRYNKPIRLDVKHGIWQFEHYFENLKDDDRYCYSKFTLKE